MKKANGTPRCTVQDAWDYLEAGYFLFTYGTRETEWYRLESPVGKVVVSDSIARKLKESKKTENILYRGRRVWRLIRNHQGPPTTFEQLEKAINLAVTRKSVKALEELESVWARFPRS